MRAARRTVHFLVVEGLPTSAFSFSYTPSATTLFRFSALTFNGHHIHLDRDYAQRSEGYPGTSRVLAKRVLYLLTMRLERLVHGPLTALMLLETLLFHRPDAKLRSFKYRAINPVAVNRPMTIHGALEGDGKALLWTEDADGVVGMNGTVRFQ